MKKNIVIAAIAAASAILLSVSCSKQDKFEPNAEGKVFTASIDQETTKTVLTDDFKVEWVEGESIAINGGALYQATPNATATSARFTYYGGTGVPEAPYKAIYPSDICNLFYSTYFLPATQTYEAGKLNAPLYAESENENLVFKNICGVICLSLKGTDKISKISIFANEAVCGEFTMTDATTMNLTGTDKSVSLDCGAAQLNATTATKFYIYLPPKEYSAGMTFVITNTAGETFVKTTTKTAVIKRANVYTFDWTPTFSQPYPDGILPGVFSVSEDNTVQFSMANIWYNGSEFLFESGQYVGLTERNDAHIDSFYWSKNVSEATAGSYESPAASASDVLFTNATETTPNPDFTVAGIKGVFRSLSKDEWYYLANFRDNAANLIRFCVEVCGNKDCIVIAPDRFTGSIADSYSYTEWLSAEEAGLVCLPYFAGNDFYICHDAISWTSSPVNDEIDCAYNATYYAGYNMLTNGIVYRRNKAAIRLVKDVE